MLAANEERFQDLVHLAESRTHALLKRASDHYRIPALQAEVRFDLRGQSAGQARVPTRGRAVIRYNLQLLWENGERFLSRTVPHEAAHLIAQRLHGARIRPHGEEWQAVMHLLGADPSRCHTYDTSRVAVRRLLRYAYHCACREHALTSIRHKRILAGQTYYCGICRKTLEPGPRSGSR
jgi:SprT protein